MKTKILKEEIKEIMIKDGRGGRRLDKTLDQILALIKKRLPKEKKAKTFSDFLTTPAGYNQALKEIKDILK